MPQKRISLLIVIAMVSLLAMAFFDRNPLVRHAQSYAEEIATSSALLYVSLRSVNSVLSTAQEVEVGGSLVVSGSFQPLKALEPVDDTIERISDVVFTLMMVTGILAVALGPVSATGSAMIALAASVLMIERHFGRGRRIAPAARRIGWYGAFLAVAVPVAFAVAALVADQMTDTVWQKHNAVVEEISASVSAQVDGSEDATSWYSGMMGLAEDAESYQKVMTETFARADELISSYITILSVFIFRILVLPLMVLGGFYVLFRGFSARAG